MVSIIAQQFLAIKGCHPITHVPKLMPKCQYILQQHGIKRLTCSQAMGHIKKKIIENLYTNSFGASKHILWYLNMSLIDWSSCLKLIYLLT